MNTDMNQAKIEGPFLAIELEKMAVYLCDTGFEFKDFGIWAFEDIVFRDLIQGKSEKYVEDFRRKRLTETSSDWYENFCRGEIGEEDVEEFFTRFQIEHQTAIRLGLLQQFRVVSLTDEQGYYYFKVLGPVWLDQ